MRKRHTLHLMVFVVLLLVTYIPGGSESVMADSPGGGAEKTLSPKAGAGPSPGLEGLDDQGGMRISDTDRCPVCAMKVANYPKFSCAVQVNDGTTYYFCATGCMIRAWLHPEAFLNVSRQDIKAVVVRDYFSGEEVDGLTAVWVAGSDVIGPMGPALVPLKDENHVEAFMRRHGGKMTFHLQQLDDEKWQAMTGKRAAP